MSDPGWPDDDEEVLDMPTLETEQGRDAWTDFIMDVEGDEDGEWAQAIVVEDDENMVLRVRYPDGDESVFDMAIRKKTTFVKKAAEGEAN